LNPPNKAVRRRVGNRQIGETLKAYPSKHAATKYHTTASFTGTFLGRVYVRRRLLCPANRWSAESATQG